LSQGSGGSVDESEVDEFCDLPAEGGLADAEPVGEVGLSAFTFGREGGQHSGQRLRQR